MKKVSTLVTKRTCALLAVLMLFFLLGDIFISRETSADTIYPEITVTSAQKTITAEKDKEFIIDYTFTPKPIPVDALNTTVDKEIILVIDTSGSMADKLNNTSTKKITALIKAAKAFVKKFANEEKTKIGIVAYSTKGRVTQGLIDAKNTSTLEKKLDELSSVTGATNIGEGMRQALKELNKNTTAMKYVILMSDGEPTAFSYSGSHQQEKYDKTTGAYDLPESGSYKLSGSLFTSLTDSSDMKTGFYSGTNDPNRYALKFGKNMASIGKDKGIKSYAVGFTLQGNGENKLKEIAAAGDGVYYNGNNENEIIKIYEEIATKIISEYIMVNNTITYSSLANLTYTGTEYQPVVQGNEVTLKLPDIKYTLNSNKTQYVADPFTISLKFKASNYGDYSLGSANLVFNYLDIEKKTRKLELPIVKINVPSPVELLNLSRTIENSSDNNVPINSNFNMLYTITPSPITPNLLEKKEIVLVIDNSISMDKSNKTGETKKKIEIVKEQAINLVNSFAGNPNVKIGIVTHDQSASVKTPSLISLNDTEEIKSIINSISVSAQAENNIGDGIRRALNLLSYNNGTSSDVDKNIILISDGNNSYYSYENYWVIFHRFYTDINNEAAKSTNRSLNTLVASDYHKTMAQIITDRENPKKIKAYYMLLKTEDSEAAGLLTEMNNKSGGDIIYNLHEKSESEVITAFKTIIEKIRGGSLKITAPKLKVTSKSGFNLTSTTTEYTFKDVVYSFNPSSGKYEASPQTIPVGYKATVIGNDGITLSGDSSLSYKDLKGSDINSKFPDMLIRVRDNTQIKLGIFSSTPIPGKSTGENYLNTDLINPEFAENFPIRMATMVKNYGEGSQLKITLNKDNSKGISKVDINKSDVKVYKIVDNNLVAVAMAENSIIITGSGTKSADINITIPKESSSKESYYIINYNFTSSVSEAEDLEMKDKILTVYGEVLGSGKKDSFSVMPVLLPDVF